jgi:hypothetical protein
MRRLSRARFLQLSGAAFPTALCAQKPAPSNAERRRISELITAFDAQGIHRTATAIDNTSADWLRELAEMAGGEARLMSFALNRVDLVAARLTAGGRTIEGLPFFDGGFTSERGIPGRLGTPDSTADIALVTLDQTAIPTEGESIATLRRRESLRGIVAVTIGGFPGLVPSNARSFVQPFGVPVLQVGSEHQALLTRVAAEGTPIIIVAAATRTPSQASNVVANVSGSQANLAPLVVMTPRSGWWQCASERGGGLACWIETLRAVSAAKPARQVIFLASSGHELGHQGLDAFLRERPELIKGARAWIHLGTSIGAAGGQMRIQASDDEIEASTLQAIEKAGASVAKRVSRGTVPTGEARNIHTDGGRYVSLLGTSPHFHTQQDRWPGAVDVDAIARFAQGVSAVAVTLARG